LALASIERISDFVNSLTDRPLKLEVGYDLEKETFLTIDTTATRELVYNIEHAVHHMAIMKIGVREIASYVKLAPDLALQPRRSGIRKTQYLQLTSPGFDNVFQLKTLHVAIFLFD
jgi:hypothetical protein